MSITFSCPTCERDLKVKDEFAGRKIKCPHCAKAVSVPAEEMDEESEEFDEAPEEQERPRKKKKKRKEKSNAPLVIGIIAGILLLGGGVVGLAAMMRKKDDTQTKAPPPPPVLDKKGPPKFEPKPQKGKGLISAVARRMESTEVNNWFKQLGLMYLNVSTDTTSGAGPRNFEQLGREFASSPLKEWHDKQWIVIVWNVRLPNVQEKSSTALAWETDADGQGNRIVLMCDLSVQSIDEATFAKTAKAMGK